MMHDLLDTIVMPAFDNEYLRQGNDQAVMPVMRGKPAFTTDSYVVDPLFFPGGCIGDLAVNGTINDLAVGGALPLALSVALIIEEGLDIGILRKVVEAMGEASRAAGVPIVTGDTKVVGRGQCDGLFVTTSGIGEVPDDVNLGGCRIKDGDVVIVSGPIGEHGVAIASCREWAAFETPVKSDTAPLHRLVNRMLTAGEVHAMRDPTRGGLAATLNELAVQSGTGIEIDESVIPLTSEVKQACALFGFDPLNLACEGRLAAFVKASDADAVVEAMHGMEEGREAAIAGRVTTEGRGLVRMRTLVGGLRMIPMPSGELLPRIC
jgi:hydrogenase expression/formation protein HypE